MWGAVDMTEAKAVPTPAVAGGLGLHLKLNSCESVEQLIASLLVVLNRLADDMRSPSFVRPVADAKLIRALITNSRTMLTQDGSFGENQMNALEQGLFDPRPIPIWSKGQRAALWDHASRTAVHVTLISFDCDTREWLVSTPTGVSRVYYGMLWSRIF